jgi:hypothetical protein
MVCMLILLPHRVIIWVPHLNLIGLDDGLDCW